MSNDVERAPPEPLPFDPERLNQAAALRRPLLIGCGIGGSVLIVLSLLLVALLGAKSGEVVGWALRMAEDAVLSATPEDWSEGDTDSLRRAFRAASEAISSERADLEALAAMNRYLMACLRKVSQDQLTRDELLSLTRSLEAVAGERSLDRPAKGLVRLLSPSARLHV